MAKRRMKGFTLIELLLVTAIIGILAVLAIPQYRIYATKACNATAQGDLNNFKTFMEVYRTDSGGYPNI